MLLYSILKMQQPLQCKISSHSHMIKFIHANFPFSQTHTRKVVCDVCLFKDLTHLEVNASLPFHSTCAFHVLFWLFGKNKREIITKVFLLFVCFQYVFVLCLVGLWVGYHLTT